LTDGSNFQYWGFESEIYFPSATGAVRMVKSAETGASLEPQLTEADRAAHQDFIAPLGERPICDDFDNEVRDIVTKFPGPITLLPSRLKYWFMIVLGVGMTAASVLASFLCLSRLRAGIEGAGVAAVLVILGTAFFGIATVVFVILLRRGSLRLDEDGFEVTGLVRKRFRWREVSGFDVFYFRGNSLVMFKTTNPRRNILEKFNAVLTGGRNEGIPADYELAAEKLVQLLTAWRNLAVDETTLT
jgi:hypothetical protein